MSRDTSAEDRIIAQARAINRVLLIVVLLIVTVLIGYNWARPAHAAEPVETLDYSAGENPRDIGDWPAGPIYVDATWVHRRWPVSKVVRQLRTETGLDIRVDRQPRDLPSYVPCGSREVTCVTVSSDRDRYTGPTGRRLGEVSLWSTKSAATGGRWILDAADVSLDDTDGKRAGRSKREERLRHYLRQAVGR